MIIKQNIWSDWGGGKSSIGFFLIALSFVLFYMQQYVFGSISLMVAIVILFYSLKITIDIKEREIIVTPHLLALIPVGKSKRFNADQFDKVAIQMSSSNHLVQTRGHSQQFREREFSIFLKSESSNILIATKSNYEQAKHLAKEISSAWGLQLLDEIAQRINRRRE